MTDTAKGCDYNGTTYSSGVTVCQTNDLGEHVCKKCVDGEWKPSDKTCAPGSDGSVCS